MKDYLKRKIESYRTSNDKRPLMIDVSSIEELELIYESYLNSSFIDVLEIGKQSNELPTEEDIYQELESCGEKDICLIKHLGSYLKLFGRDKVNSVMHTILGKSYKTKFVILTYQLGKFYQEKDLRLKDKVVVDDYEETSSSCSLIFVGKKYRDNIESYNGLRAALQYVEKEDGTKILVSTSYLKQAFPESLISIYECESPYDLLCLKDNNCKKLSKKYGESQQWANILDKLEENSVEKTLDRYVNSERILYDIENWLEKDDFEKWTLFLYLKLKNYKSGNWAIDEAIQKTENYKKIVENIYLSIFDLNPKDESFWKKYDDRKKILKKFKDDEFVFQYCNLVKSKNENALFYLTDVTDQEKKTVIQIIDAFGDKFTKTVLMNILKHVYPDLYDYLCDYNLGNENLNNYFNQYKLLKILNRLTPDFKKLVDDEALERSFKKILMCRSEKLEDINYDKSVVYFVDALGVEFMSFIERKCSDKGLACKSSICRASLPTITSVNAPEFRDFFAKKGVDVVDEKRLDNLKHDGKDDYDFDKNKLPIHVIEEFSVIDDCLNNIRKKIKSGIIKKAVIVSDHGATRLAILNTDMVKEDVESVGEHGGRVCKEVPGMKNIPNAIIENGYCILADYNSFKGGRVGKVEMHGGATLEEVTVPIIEITDKQTSVNITIPNNEKILKVSFKKVAKLHFIASNYLTNVIVKINGNIYTAKSDDGLNFIAELPDLKKSGVYSFEVWSDSQLVSDNNEFSIEKESASTNDLWR